MTTMSAADARKHFSEVIDAAQTEEVTIERRGRSAAVVVSPERYARMLEALEELEDAMAWDDSLAEEGPNIPWDRVRADLGWE